MASDLSVATKLCELKPSHGPHCARSRPRPFAGSALISMRTRSPSSFWTAHCDTAAPTLPPAPMIAILGRLIMVPASYHLRRHEDRVGDAERDTSGMHRLERLVAVRRDDDEAAGRRG